MFSVDKDLLKGVIKEAVYEAVLSILASSELSALLSESQNTQPKPSKRKLETKAPTEKTDHVLEKAVEHLIAVSKPVSETEEQTAASLEEEKSQAAMLAMLLPQEEIAETFEERVLRIRGKVQMATQGTSVVKVRAFMTEQKIVSSADLTLENIDSFEEGLKVFFKENNLSWEA
jgi:hypothetical protein